jgi:hypothetical protein
MAVDVFKTGDGREYATAASIARAAGVSRQAAHEWLSKAMRIYGLPAYRHPENRREVLYPLGFPALQSFLAGTCHQKERRKQ